MEIKPIKITGNAIPEVNIFDNSIPQVFTGYPIPVTVNIGFPVVDMPGCVETRETDDLKQVDPRGNMTFCDGQVPSYNAPNFEPNQIVPTRPSGVDTRQPKAPEAPDLPIPKTPVLLLRWTAPHQHKQRRNLSAHTLRGLERKLLTIS